MKIKLITQTITLLLMSYLLLSCSRIPGNEKVTTELVSTGWQEVEATTLYTPSDLSPSGRMPITKPFQTEVVSDTMPAKVNIQFGSFLKVNSHKASLDVERIWTFPRLIVDNKGKEFARIRRSLTIPTNKIFSVVYILEEPWEVVEGEWTLEYLYKGESIFKQSYWISKQKRDSHRVP